MKYNTFLATIQLVNRICDADMYNTDESIAKLSWSDFVADITEPELIQYLKERHLYVNVCIIWMAGLQGDCIKQVVESLCS